MNTYHNVSGLNLSVNIEMVSLKKISFMLFKRDMKHNTTLTNKYILKDTICHKSQIPMNKIN